MLKRKLLAIAIMISFAGIISSCYYDYGIDPDTSNVVLTAYNNTYNFGQITKYYLVDTVFKVGSSSITNTYDTQILQDVKNNLDALGWTQTTAADTSAGVMNVSCGLTSSTYYVDNYDYWWYGGGYYWYYPPYYSYSYSYTTGTLAIIMADENQASADQLPIQWSGVLNGVTGQSNPQSLITQGINQAFAQSPYLK